MWDVQDTESEETGQTEFDFQVHLQSPEDSQWYNGQDEISSRVEYYRIISF
jgi:hypothetical protein